MIGFLKSLYFSLPSKARWQIALGNLFASLLGLSWLIQLHFLVTGFSVNQQINIYLVISTSISFLVAVGFTYYQSRRHITHNNTVLKKLGSQLWAHFLSWEHPEFRKQQRIYFFDVFMVNFWRVRGGYQAILMNALPAFCTAIFILAFVLYLYPLVTLLFLGLYGLLFLSQIKLRRALAKATGIFHISWRTSTYALGRLIDQFELYKIGRGREDVTKDYDQSLDKYLQDGDNVSYANARWSSIQTVFSQVGRVTIVLMIYYFFKMDLIDASSIVFLVIVMGWLHAQLTRVQQIYPVLLESTDAYNFLENFMAQNKTTKEQLLVTKEVPDQTLSHSSLIPIEEIQLNNIGFGYETDKAVLKSIDLCLKKGKTYLLKGRNGCGKTTLAKLLVGFLVPEGGQILINNKPVESMSSYLLQSRMSYLHQDFSLFYGTVKENFSFGSKKDNQTEKQEFQHYFDELMSDIDDPDYHIGEKGDRLSGGQKQRLALIREWGRQADLYILDEPLNHLDEESTEWLKQSIAAKKQHAIIIIISHLEGFESLADEILTMDHGQL